MECDFHLSGQGIIMLSCDSVTIVSKGTDVPNR